jgi:hypothetical protein
VENPWFQRNLASQTLDYSVSLFRLWVSCSTNARNTQQAGASSFDLLAGRHLPELRASSISAASSGGIGML